MTLTLTTLRGPDGVPPETRRLAGGSLSIGRSPSAADWVLPDPDRVLSKRHCIVSFEHNAWHVTDVSANGTSVNQDSARLPQDEPTPLRDGDRLLLGAYEIEAQIGAAARLPPVAREAKTADFEERLIGDPFPPIETDHLGIALPPMEPPAEFVRTTPDHASALAQHFQPPRPNVEVLPVNWDLDLPAPAPLPGAAAPGPGPTPAAEPAAVAEPEAPAPSPPLAPAPSPPLAPAPAGSEARAFAAFAAGAGIETVPPADPLAALDSLGAAFRVFVVGLRQAMIARATVKGTFRIDQTMLQAVGNNPLKFSADDEDAMTALMGVGRRTGMTAAQAVGEAMRDIRLHELAMAAAMQQAVRDLLARLAPAEIERQVPPDAVDFLPGRRGTRLWRGFENRHRVTTDALANDFDTVFGLSFMRAYERALGEFSAAQPEEFGNDQDRPGRAM